MATKEAKKEYTETDLRNVADNVFSALADDHGVTFREAITEECAEAAVQMLKDSITSR